MDYSWAVNKLKLKIAEMKVKQHQAESGKEVNEENVKEWYIKLGGLLAKETKKGRPKNDKTPVMDSKA